MNDILQLKGTLQRRPHDNKPSARNMPANSSSVTSRKIKILIIQLRNIYNYWIKQSVINGCLVDVCYIDVVAKSNRVQGIFVSGGSVNDCIVGARFSGGKKKKHIITYHIKEDDIRNTIKNLINCSKLLDKEFSGELNHDLLKSLNDKVIKYELYEISKTKFRNIIVDLYYIERFSIPDNSANIGDQSIITIYKTGIDLIDIMNDIGINIQPDKVLSNTTLLLYPDEIKLLKEKAPYLIAMATEDLSRFNFGKFIGRKKTPSIIKIPSPGDEPVVGVIDTLFDESVYFSEWVDYREMVSDEIPKEPKDYFHGTSVSSIIVDGPAINPDLDDGCGRFKVRHFGVAVGNKYSAFSILKAIKEIVVTNPDIKVWNLSLGSDREINPNFISPEAAVLDQIQYENNVIFIIAGTNKRGEDLEQDKMIGSPADSINSIVVNSVDSKNKPATYSRRGIVLSFFNKPDISFYGGDKDSYIRVCTPNGEEFCGGTSFAAPWITRKVAYLIEVLGLSREVAKALIVDSSAGWNNTSQDPELAPLIGYGVVPVKIENIIKSNKSEIKFIISDVSEKWDTYSYNLPVPINKNKHPFIAKATLCYFPSCSINQGVDYTDTELDVYFGRIKNKTITSINKNKQSNDSDEREGEKHYIYEDTARKFYRKWDNVKHINEVLTEKIRPRSVYDRGMWGLSIKAKDRLKKRDHGLNFGLVVTLREIYGVNRINEFVRNCELLGWLVNRIDIDSRIDIYNKAKDVIVFD